MSWSVMAIIQSWFEGNSVGLGAVVEIYYSDVMIFNTNFLNSTNASYICNLTTDSDCYNCYNGSIVDTNGTSESLVLCNFMTVTAHLHRILVE